MAQSSSLTGAGSKALWPLRLAREADAPELEALIALSVRKLQAASYTEEQREAAIGTVFGVDHQLIRDGTYLVAEEHGRIVGCGGWSRRRKLCGSSTITAGEADALDPRIDAARVRAFFVHPDYARRGIGRSIMAACEEAIMAAGFKDVLIVATLAGEPLYASFGYTVVERYETPMANGLTLPVVRMTKTLATSCKTR